MRHLCTIALALGVLSSAAALAKTSSSPEPFCEQPQGRCVDVSKLYAYDKKYVGHDEPSLIFYSNKAGAGNTGIYYLRLPTDPPTPPNQAGTGGTFNFQLHPTFWVGMVMCDTQSFPEFSSTCTPDSDSNIADNRDPDSKDYMGHHAGAAFMEMQFYPPGWAPWPPGFSCDATHWCAALNIDSFSFDPNNQLSNNFDCLITVGQESVNFAFLTYSGVAHTPANPQNMLAATTVNPATDLFMNPGDQLRVSMWDTDAGFHVLVEDLTTHKSGSMTASVANGFAQVKFDPFGATCQTIPYAFHPMYSTSSVHTNAVWTAHTYNTAFSDEIGHFEYCNTISGEGGFCEDTEGNGAAADFDDFPCFDAAFSTRWAISGCIGADFDYDGPDYLADWPGTLANVAQDQLLHAAPIEFTSPLFISSNSGKKENYSAVAFETDSADLQPLPPCNVFATDSGCTMPPPGAAFYPIYTTASSGATGCVWHLGGPFLPNTTNTFGGTSTAEYGPRVLSYFPQPFGFAAGFFDFRNTLAKNPCPTSAD
jgi:hypothetical protein